MANNINGIQKEIKASEQKLETVINFKNLGAIISDIRFNLDVVAIIAQCTAIMTSLLKS